MECDCSSHPMYEDYHLRASRQLEQEHHAASVQFKKYSEGTFYVKLRNYLVMAVEVLEDLRLLSCEEVGGLSEPGPRDA